MKYGTDESWNYWRWSNRGKYGENAAIIGQVTESKEGRGNKVFLRTAFGSTRVLDMLVGEQLPRIC